MELVNDFFNKVVKCLDNKYFPEVSYYRDSKNTISIHHNTELFSNGCLMYGDYIKHIARACKDTEENIEKLLSEFIL